MKIVVTGAAGLVGQNLIARLKDRGGVDIVALDKHAVNVAQLSKLHPDITIIAADLAEAGAWQSSFAGADAVIGCHAQIGGIRESDFQRNNVDATARVIDAAKAASVPYMVHLSSSVVNSAARDFYTESKKEQERLVTDSGLPCTILRPTLMFGWFDRKHLGWLARFMKASPVFPIPGNGRYLRQPLYVGDLCNIIFACLERRPAGQSFNISGLQKIPYIDLVRALRAAAGARALLLPVPYRLFWLALWTYALFDRDPPFTVKQLEALVIPEVFEIIDWPAIFGVTPTPLDAALAETFRHPVYSRVALEF